MPVTPIDNLQQQDCQPDKLFCFKLNVKALSVFAPERIAGVKCILYLKTVGNFLSKLVGKIYLNGKPIILFVRGWCTFLL